LFIIEAQKLSNSLLRRAIALATSLIQKKIFSGFACAAIRDASGKDLSVNFGEELIVQRAGDTVNFARVNYEGHINFGRALADHVYVRSCPCCAANSRFCVKRQQLAVTPEILFAACYSLARQDARD
jgi:hypothetical protein